MVKTNISISPWWGATWFTSGRGIDANRLKMKIIEVYLKSSPNLIHVLGDGRAEEGALYVDLQIPEDAIPTTNFEIWVTTWHVLQSNWWIADWTLIVAKNPDSEFQMLCSDTGVVYYKKGDEWVLLWWSWFVIEEAVCELFDSTKSYQAWDIVIHQGNRFIANEAIPAWAWDQTKWTHETIQEAIDKKSQSMFVTEDEYNALPARKESDWNLYIFVDEHPTIVEPESIVFKVRADENGNLVIGTWWWRNTVWVTESVPYDWDVRIDGSRESTRYQKAWTDPITRALTIATWLTPNSIHTVKITPHNTSSPYKRARAYGWYGSLVADKLVEVIFDGCAKGFCDSATYTWPYYMADTYRECVNLRTAPAETLPDTITQIWVCYRSWEFYGCTWLTAPAVEYMPDGVTQIGDWFKQQQYRWCTWLTRWADEVMAEGASLSWYWLRMEQYYGCTWIKKTGREHVYTTHKYVWDAYKASQYKNCTWLEEITLWSNSNILTAWSTVDNFRDDMFVWCPDWVVMTCEWRPTTLVRYAGVFTNSNSLSECRVPSAYLQEYIDSTDHPWNEFNNSIYVWY